MVRRIGWRLSGDWEKLELEAFKRPVIEQGWYTADQLTICKSKIQPIAPSGSVNLLSCYPIALYKQSVYFIPLAHDGDYAVKKEVPFKLDAIV